MKMIPLYKAKKSDGSISITLTKPEGEYTQMVRIVADSGMSLTANGIQKFPIVDTESTEGWREIIANNNF